MLTASSSRTQVPGQAARAVARLTSGVVSTVIHQRPWLAVVEVTHLVTQHQPVSLASDRERPPMTAVARAARRAWPRRLTHC